MKTGLLLAVIFFLLLPGCAGQTTAVSASPAPAASAGEPAEGQELFCLAESREKAEELAELYEIEFVDYAHGVATFHAEDPQAVIARGDRKPDSHLADRLQAQCSRCDNQPLHRSAEHQFQRQGHDHDPGLDGLRPFVGCVHH